MKHRHHQYHHDKNLHPVNAAPVAMPAPEVEVEEKQHGIDFTPAADQIAHRAYEIYVSQGCHPGYDLKHWLEAEQQLVEERNITLDRGVPAECKQ
jgi:hypothetical protein